MPSTFTQNLGIEQPATGEQANTWGITVNRNMNTLDTAINGNTSIPLSTSPYQLTINNGQDKPVAANPMITWTGAQTGQGSVHIDWQSARQHLYFMSNQTSGGFGIAFAQGSGAQFVLQAGYAAIIYADGGGAGANVAAALASPQFTNVLATGTLTVNGGSLQLGIVSITADAQGNVKLTGGLGVGDPTSIPDPVTILGEGYGQLRMVQGSYGVFFRNDGTNFYWMVTAAGDPYGSFSGNFPIFIDLVSRNVGMAGWGPNTGGSYGLSVPTIHANAVTVDNTISAGGGLASNGGINNTNARSAFKSGDQYQIGLEYGSFVNWIGTNAQNQFQLANANAVVLMAVDQTGNMALSGGLHVLAGGVQFPDGTIQTTAGGGNNFAGNVTVQGVINGPASALQSPVLYCFPFGSTYPSGPPNSIMFSHNESGNFVTFWVIKSDGTKWIGTVNLIQPAAV